MKKILGLDIGTTSIGWAYVHEAEHEYEHSSIIELGVRVNPLTTDEQKTFSEGKAISTNATRRLKRGMRRNLQRYKLRRQRLIDLLLKHRIINTETTLHEVGKQTTHETLRLRAAAASERIELEQLARVLLSINRKRGYRSSRKINNGDEGRLIDSMDIARTLYEHNLTPGEWLYQELQAGRLRGKPDFYRSDLARERERIWQQQQKHYPEILTNTLYGSICENKFSKVRSAYKLSDPEPNKGTKQEQKRRMLRWRSEAVNQQVSLPIISAVIAEIEKAIDKSSGYLGEISDRSKALSLCNQTVGQYLYAQVKAHPHGSLRNQVFNRQDYLDEFERIWETQRQFHPQLSDALKAEIRDVVIFYQRQLRSQKHCIRFCELEKFNVEISRPDRTGDHIGEHKALKVVGPRVAPRSSPLFQEFKIWQMLSHIIIRPKGSLKRKVSEEHGVRSLSLEEKEILFRELNIREKLSITNALKHLNLPSRSWEMNFQELEGNYTNAALYKAYLLITEMEGCDLSQSLGIKADDWEMKDIAVPAKTITDLIHQHFEMLGIDTRVLYFDPLCSGKEFYQQSAYALWHLLYSYEDAAGGNDRLYRLLSTKYGFALEHCRLLAGAPLLPDHCNLSAKALRKILPHLRERPYSEACRCAYPSIEIQKRPLADKLALLSQGSLRQPVVEKILNQLINLINALMAKYSTHDQLGNVLQTFHFDEIRIELARELKKNAKERERLFKETKDGEARNKKITEILRREFDIQYPTRNDIIRYRLYQELEANGYKDLYHNKYISRDLLFSGEIDIEHIIPQARIFDDSFANKTLTYRADNIKKGNRTALDYISQDYVSELETYINRIQHLLANKALSPAKAERLLKSASDLNEGFIERDLRLTQYINRKAHEILSDITHRVVSTSGKITDRLRRDWGLVQVMKEINLDKYRALGRTERIQRRNGAEIEVIKDWTKRNDHRHHAMDALTVAFTKQSYIQYFNSLNARYDDDSSELRTTVLGIQQRETECRLDNNGEKKRLIKLPMPNFRSEARKHLEGILISHKAKNKVATRNLNKPKGSDKAQICMTPRGELHKETVYGKRKILNKTPQPIGPKLTPKRIGLIANPEIRCAIEAHIAKYPSIAVALDKKTLKQDPIIHRGEPIDQVYCYDEVFTIRKPITADLKIETVLDEKVQAILYQRLKEYNGDAKRAFSDLDKYPIWINEAQGICLKRVTIKTQKRDLEAIHSKRTPKGEILLDGDGRTMPIDYVENSSNHHVAIYRDATGKLQEQVVSMMTAIARVNAGLPIIDKRHNVALGWEFLFTLKKNEMFIFPNTDTGFDPHEIDLLDPRNKAQISPHIYRVRKITSNDYLFWHHLETTVKSEIKGVTFHRIKLNALEGCVKVRLNHLGDIVQVGEY